MLWRTLAGFAIAAAIALAARRAGTLSRDGGVAAVTVGTMAVAGGWRWGALLVAFFISSIALSRWRAADKEQRTVTIIAKGGERDAVQVIANGGLFALAAFLSSWWPGVGWAALGAGALAASTSDTWATEIGTLVGGTPLSIITGRRVATGQSGGVTLAGTLAAGAGALFIALVARLLGWSLAVSGAALAGGIVGSTLDSLIGGSLQALRWCDACASVTERIVHSCGNPARSFGGIPWIDNDVVNLVSSVGGGLVAVALVH